MRRRVLPTIGLNRPFAATSAKTAPRDPMKYDADRAYHRGDRIRWAGKLLVHDGRQFVEDTAR